MLFARTTLAVLLASLDLSASQKLSLGDHSVYSASSGLVLAEADGAMLTLSSGGGAEDPSWVSSHANGLNETLVLSGVPVGCVGMSYDTICAPPPSLAYFPATFQCSWTDSSGAAVTTAAVKPTITKVMFEGASLGMQVTVDCPEPTIEEIIAVHAQTSSDVSVAVKLSLKHITSNTVIPFKGASGGDDASFTVPAFESPSPPPLSPPPPMLPSPPPPAPPPPARFEFKSSQVINGKVVSCVGGVRQTSSYTECKQMTVDGHKGHRNGVTCGPEWRTSDPQGGSLVSFCNSLTGSGNGGSFHYKCEGSTTRFTWNSGSWGTANDNGYVDDIRCNF